MTTDQSASLDAALTDVFSPGRDRGGNSAPPETQPPAEPAAPPPAAEATPPPVSPEAVDPNTGRMVPLAELTNERKKLKGERDEERRLRMEAEARAKVYQEQIDAARRQPPPQAPQRQPVHIPDPVTDPEAYARFVHQTAQQQVFDERLNASEDRARDKYGDDTVNEAFQAAQAAGLVGPQSPLLQQRHPWGAMVEWFKQQKALQTIGSDPDAYANRIREEERAKVLAELKAGNGPTAGAPQQFPGTLASATQQGATGQITKNLEAATSDVFAPDRKARGMRR
ncbi:Scaffolding protein [Hyphomicrobium sp. 1Nfss2.1]|uniref:hypothetical protein n=1 Tax=Hyphomicrobium sp. 1Nfss2.1 TaxID=3413936 RepID=UPI003C7CEBF6